MSNTAYRLRKAWSVRVAGYDHAEIYYAATAYKARLLGFWSVSDCNSAVRMIDVKAHRAPQRDMKLPVADAVALDLPEEDRRCLLHAFGADQCDPIKAGYRDYFYTFRDDPPLVRLTEIGLMKPMDGDKFGENMTYFVLTPAGKHAALSLTPEYAR